MTNNLVVGYKKDIMENVQSMKPLWGNVLIELLDDASPSDIIRPSSLTSTSYKGKIITVGTGNPDGNGQIVPMALTAGETVYFNKNKAEEIEVSKKTYYIVDQLHCWAVIK